MKIKEENLPTQVAEDTIIFTDLGNIYVSTTTGTLKPMNGGGGSSGEGDSNAYSVIIEKLANLEAILHNESSAFYRPKMATIAAEDIMVTNDYLNTSTSSLGTYASAIGTNTVSYVIAIPPDALNITVTKKVASSRFMLATFTSLPVEDMKCTQYVRDDATTQLALAKITKEEKYLVVYVSNISEYPPVAINLILKKVDAGDII